MKAGIDHLLPPDFASFTNDEVYGTIPQRFSRIVEANGSRVAVSEANRQTSYLSLERRSNTIAHRIIECLGSGAEPVALLFPSGADYCSAALGVLKSGKFYSTIDSELETERLVSVMRDLGARLILCSPEFEPQAKVLAARMEACKEFVTDESTPESDAQVSPSEPICAKSAAYVVYTSGSTGAPEGVVVTHRSLLHMVMNQTQTGHLGREDRLLQICHLSGAAAASEMFAALLTGGTLYPYSLKAAGPSGLLQLLVHEGITVSTFVPVVFRLLLSCLRDGQVLPDMRLIRLSGDRVLRRDYLEFTRHFSRKCILRASLGASEAMVYTQFNMHHDCAPDREIVPAGHALPGVQIFVVDDEGCRLGSGESGEIVVKSEFLAAGYWNNRALTEERFKNSGDIGDERLYFTRDIGLLEPDGCLIHLGRKDARVKIHGKLVVVSEIEEEILALPGVTVAAVVAISDEIDDRHLVAYYVAMANAGVSPGDVKRAMRKKFPLEVVPRRVLQLRELPVTSRNKVDRRLLQSDVARFEREAVAAS